MEQDERRLAKYCITACDGQIHCLDRLIACLNSSETETRELASNYQREHRSALDELISRAEMEALSEGVNVEDLPAGHIGHVFRGLAGLANYTLSFYERVQALCDEGRFGIKNERTEVLEDAQFYHTGWTNLRQSLRDSLLTA